jgi:hypothetical protein
VGAGLAAAAGVALWFGAADLLPEVPAIDLTDEEPASASLPLPVLLTGKETDRDMKADYRAIKASASDWQAGAGQSCGAAAGRRLRVEVVVEPDGQVRAGTARQVGGTYDQVSECLVASLSGARLARKGAGPVRTELDLAW